MLASPIDTRAGFRSSRGDSPAERPRKLVGILALPIILATMLYAVPLDRASYNIAVSSSTGVPPDIRQMLSENIGAGGLASYLWALIYTIAILRLVKAGWKEVVNCLADAWPILAVVLLIPFALLWNPMHAKILSNFVHVIGTTLIAAATAVHFRGRPEILVRVLCVSLTVNVSLNLAFVLMFPGSAIYDGRWMGVAGHPNTLGTIAALAGFFGLVLLLTDRSKKGLGLISVLLSLVVLAGTQSATSMLSAAFGGLVLAASNRAGRDRLRYARSGASPWMPVALAVAVIAASIGPQWFGFVTRAFGKSTDLTGRVDIWRAAIDVWLDRPLLGWGFDGNAYSIVRGYLSHGQFHNGYLDLLVRGGCVSLVLVGILVARHYRMARSAGGLSGALSLAFLTLLLMHNVSEASLLKPRNVIWVVYLSMFMMAARPSAAPVQQLDRKLTQLAPPMHAGS